MKPRKKKMLLGVLKEIPSLLCAKEFVDELNSFDQENTDYELVLCMPDLLIATVPEYKSISKCARINASSNVCATLLNDLGVKYCLLGKKEDRALGETDVQINEKAMYLLKHGITPIICIGENETERGLGVTAEILSYQVNAALYGMTEDQLRNDVVFAYEPCFCVGERATEEQRNASYSLFKNIISNSCGVDVSRKINLLYRELMNH